MKRVLFLFLFLISCGHKEPAKAWQIHCDESVNGELSRVGVLTDNFFSTPDPGELYGCLPTPDFATWEDRRPFYSVHLTNLKLGDVLAAAAEGEVTNDTYYCDLMLCGGLVLTDSPLNHYLSSARRELTDFTCTNITPGQHHGIIQKSVFYRLQEDMPDVYLNFEVYAAGCDLYSDEKFIIEQSYGSLTGFISKAPPAP